VFVDRMKIKASVIGLAVLALAATVALAATSAATKSIVLGKTPNYPESGCPQAQGCQVVARVTGIQMKADGIDHPFVAPATGKIISWWLKLPQLRPSFIKSFSDLFGGPPSARIAVLRRGAQGRLRLVRQGPIEQLAQYLGNKGRTRFKLATPLPIKKGDYVGLTAVTWTPSFVVGLDPDTNSWLASRPKSRCNTPSSSDPRRFAAYYKRTDAHLQESTAKDYKCLYRTARLMYWARLVPNPPTKAIELGTTQNAPEPRCTKAQGCPVVARVTGIQQWADGTSRPFIAPSDGRIVSWRLQVPHVRKASIRTLSARFGGPPSVRIAVVRRGTRGRMRLVRESPARRLTQYLGPGGSASFRLAKPLPIKKGDYVGLTAVTWTPSFATGLSSETDRWLASRPKSRCPVPSRAHTRRFASYYRQTDAHLQPGTAKLYQCSYGTSRLMYWASMIPDAVTPAP
jgi:hypothetical protein